MIVLGFESLMLVPSSKQGVGYKFVKYFLTLSLNNEIFANPPGALHTFLKEYITEASNNGEFKPEYAGQLNFYLSAVDGILKKDSDYPSIGLLLCKSKNDLVAEYTLKDMSKPMGVSAYKVTSSLPEELQQQLPSIEDIEKRIQKE